MSLAHVPLAATNRSARRSATAAAVTCACRSASGSARAGLSATSTGANAAASAAGGSSWCPNSSHCVLPPVAAAKLGQTPARIGWRRGWRCHRVRQRRGSAPLTSLSKDFGGVKLSDQFVHGAQQPAVPGTRCPVQRQDAKAGLDDHAQRIQTETFQGPLAGSQDRGQRRIARLVQSRSTVTTAGKRTRRVSMPASVSRSTRSLPASSSTREANVAWGHASRAAKNWPA